MKGKRRPKVVDADLDVAMDRYEVSNSEDDYSEEERLILDRVRKGERRHDDSEEEVYGILSDEDDKEKDEEEEDNIDDMRSDIEDTENDGLPDSRAWGKKSRHFYNADYVDQDYGGLQAEEEELAENEEREATAIYQQLREELDEGADMLFLGVKEVKPSEDTSLKDKEKVLAKEEIEQVSVLGNDFKSLMGEIKKLSPIARLIQENRLRPSPATKFVKTKMALVLNYCNNILFYLLLKSRGISVKGHPVLKRLYQFRHMLKQLQPLDLLMEDEIDKVLSMLENGHEFPILTEVEEVSKIGRFHVPESLEMSLDAVDLSEELLASTDKDSLLKDNPVEGMINVDESESDHEKNEENEGEEDEKRGITYQIAKNKGLTPHRKKDQRNPRVKYKNQYRKAVIRRKGQVRTVRKELSKYGGEHSGIKLNVSRSIKLK